MIPIEVDAISRDQIKSHVQNLLEFFNHAAIADAPSPLKVSYGPITDGLNSLSLDTEVAGSNVAILMSMTSAVNPIRMRANIKLPATAADMNKLTDSIVNYAASYIKKAK